MGIRTGYRVRRTDGARGTVSEVRALHPGEEPCFATVEWEGEAKREELLRDLVSDPSPTPEVAPVAG